MIADHPFSFYSIIIKKKKGWFLYEEQQNQSYASLHC